MGERDWDNLERDFVGELGARFGENLRARRRAMNLSQDDISDGMVRYYSFRWHQTMVAKVERGDRAVKLDEAYALSRLVGMTLDDLVRGERMDEIANATVLVDIPQRGAKVYVASARGHGEDGRVSELLAGGEKELAERVAKPEGDSAQEWTSSAKERRGVDQAATRR